MACKGSLAAPIIASPKKIFRSHRASARFRESRWLHGAPITVDDGYRSK
jgi:hypothetical protein